MEQREEFARLAALEGTNRRELCRRFGISPQTGYKWLRRHRDGEPGLTDRSRRPHRSPNRTASELEQCVVALRKVNKAWGARKLAASLKREGVAVPAVSTVHEILRRNDCLGETKTSAPAPTRFEKEAANQLWQMDFKGWVTLGNGARCHPLTVLDDHSRYLMCLRACADQQGATVQAHLEATFRHHGLPEAMFVDNGSPWGDSGGQRWTRFSVWLLKVGVRVLHSRPYHPQSRGKIERLNRTLNAEVLSLRCFGDFARAQDRFDEWREVYNARRPHEALGMAVPADRYRPSPRSMPTRLAEPEYDEGDIVRKVGTTRAYIQFKGRMWPVGQAFFGERVAIRPLERDGRFGIYFGAHRIGEIDLAAT